MSQPDQSMLAALAAYFGNADNNPASPLHSLMDKAAGVVAGPAIDAYQGMQRVWGHNGEQYIPVEDINRTAQNIAEFAGVGSMVGPPRSAKHHGRPNPNAEKQTVYHYGKVPQGGQFDPSKSAYNGEVFVAADPKYANASANYGRRQGATTHELKLDPSAKMFDFENPAHVAAAMQWWDSQNFHGAKQIRKDVESNIRGGEFSHLEPGPNREWTVNPYIRKNFDGYYVTEGAGGAKNMALNKPGYLTRPDGSTFFSDPQAAAILTMMQNQPAQYEPDTDF